MTLPTPTPSDAHMDDYDKAVNPKRELCAACGMIARGYAYVNDDRLCHPDDGPSCYVQSQADVRSFGQFLADELGWTVSEDDS